MLPITATPSVPPASRVASFTAEPTPAFAGGSTLRIDSVAGRRRQAEAEAHQHHLPDDLGVGHERRRQRDPAERRRRAAAGR